MAGMFAGFALRAKEQLRDVLLGERERTAGVLRWHSAVSLRSRPATLKPSADVSTNATVHCGARCQRAVKSYPAHVDARCCSASEGLACPGWPDRRTGLLLSQGWLHHHACHCIMCFLLQPLLLPAQLPPPVKCT